MTMAAIVGFRYYIKKNKEMWTRWIEKTFFLGLHRYFLSVLLKLSVLDI